MWYFIVTTEDNDRYISDKYNYKLHSSDVCDLEGFVVNEEQIDILNKDENINTNDTDFLLIVLPDKYQNNVNEFISDYWDGNFSFRKKNSNKK